MEILLLGVSRPKTKWICEGISEFEKRLKHYMKYSTTFISDKKSGKYPNSGSPNEIEGKKLLSLIQDSDFVILLDEKGTEYNSISFSGVLNDLMIKSQKRIVFVVGGPYGFSDEVYKRANLMISCSKMTFTHEMIVLFFTEQLYRGFTILKGENYHHE